MKLRPPQRDRAAADLREQAEGWREAAKLKLAAHEAATMIRLAERYEALAAGSEAEA
jgi:hypothetical protein